MSERKRGCSGFSILLLLAGISILTILGFIFVSGLVARAELAFGPPAENLNAMQRLQLGARLGFRSEALARPVDAEAGVQEFAIGFGEATGAIVGRLQQMGLIREAGLFSDYLVYKGLDRQLQSGEFELSAAMTAPELALALLDPTPDTVTIAVLPGWRLEEIADSLKSAGVEVSAEEFLEAARNAPGGSVEGYLLPGVVEVEREISAEALVQALLETYNKVVDDELRAAWEAQGLNVKEALTLASIIEREAVIDGEMALIASVFLNRLEDGIRLEADSTVQYALGYDEGSESWWTRPLLTGHLQFDSPYNSYLYRGLPPTPIAAPSLEALQAVATPASSDYYFFQAACDGSGEHVFARTFEEHLGNNCP